MVQGPCRSGPSLGSSPNPTLALQPRYYNNVDITFQVSGNLAAYTVTKSVSIPIVAGAYLAIEAQDSSGPNNPSSCGSTLSSALEPAVKEEIDQFTLSP